MTSVETAAPDNATVEVLGDSGGEIHVRFPVLALESYDTGDGRFIDRGGLTHRALPISLLAQPYSSHGGQEPPPAEVFGNITALTPQDGPDVISPSTGKPYGPDVRVWSGEGVIDGTHKFAELVRKRYLRGISVDLADLDAELVDEETAAMSDHPRRQAIVHTAEIAAATMVPVPAFADAYVELIGEDPGPALAASALPVELWKEPVPMWRSSEVGDPVPAMVTDRKPLVAAGSVRRPPLTYFTDPGLTEETPMTIEEPDENGYRRVYGHIAVWSRPHIGFNGQRIYAPRSRCDYAFFNTGAVRCLDEDGTTRIAAVGHLTMDTNHADLALPAAAAARHYDHTGYAWADVAVGGDQFGTWSNGITKQDITEDQIAYAYAHPPSGDWRPLDGGLEIVAALCVNTPGIPVSRARVASGEVVALVAAGALAPTHPASGLGAVVDYEQLADVIADRILTKQQHTAALTARRTAALAATDDNTARKAELLAEIPDETPSTFEAELIESFGVTDEDLAAATELLGVMKRGNWVTKTGTGHLPPYIKRIVKHLQEKGMTEGHAIAVAKNAADRMCSSGDTNFPGLQQVNAGSRAEACSAIAEWKAKVAQSRSSK